MKKYGLALLLFALTLSLVGCTQQEAPSVTKTNLQMDTVVTITLYDWTNPETIDRAFGEISRLESLLSVEKEGSDLDRLAKAAGKEWVDISPETEEVLTLAQKYHTLSQGLFDITAGPLIDLWGIRNGEGHYPTETELASTLSLLDADALQIKNGKAYLAKTGMKANLGAIAKGYIADRVKAFLINEGVEHAVLDLGRNILLIGGKDQQNDFLIGVQDPNQPDGGIVATLSVRDCSIVTSGVYERFFVHNGERYHHILDPNTGYPVKNTVASVTILSQISVDGDALSTSCLLLGEEKGIAMIEGLEGVEAFFILEDGTTRQTSGFSDYLLSKP